VRIIVLLSVILLSGCTAKEELIKISTSKGDITVYLYPETSKHRENFIKLAREGFYDSTTFHRVMNEFMIQGGDPYTKDSLKSDQAGNGGPGYTIEAEILRKFYHKKGSIAAARTPDYMNPDFKSSGSQFYLVQGRPFTNEELDQIEKTIQRTIKDHDFKFTQQEREIYKTIGGTPFLDRMYTVFGEIVDGMEVLDSIAGVKTDAGNKPLDEIQMQVSIIEVSRKSLIEKGVIIEVQDSLK